MDDSADNSLEAVHLDGAEIPVYRGKRTTPCFEFEKPDGHQRIVAPPDMRWSDIKTFVKKEEQRAQIISEKVRDYYRMPEGWGDFKTGRIMYLVGRPIVIYINDIVFKGLTGNKGTTFFYNEMSTMIMRPAPRGQEVSYIKTYETWAQPLFEKSVHQLISSCLTHSGALFHDMEIAIDPELPEWAQLDGNMSKLVLSGSLEGYPPECIEYAFVDAVIRSMVSRADDHVRQVIMERAGIDWQRAELLLSDPVSDFLNL